MYHLDDYHYDLPDTLIAQSPTPNREGSRLLHLQRTDGTLSHRRFPDIVDLLRPSDLLVINDTQVIPARLCGRKPTGGKAELLILDYGQREDRDPHGRNPIYRCLIKASKTAGPGTRILLEADVVAQVQGFCDGVYTVAFSGPEPFDRLLNRIGRSPLPPYIKRDPTDPDGADRRRYQTVYARSRGAIAAPTAGLHFTEAILSDIRDIGVTITALTLHVGYGTFVPVRVDDIRNHRMHDEWFSISQETARLINQAKSEGRRVVAVGTTCVRALEYAARTDGSPSVTPGSGLCDLFIYPGHTFNIVDAMLTNFHLPRSTLLMLVSAFAGRDNLMRAYHSAVTAQYRFFSYGDAMFID